MAAVRNIALRIIDHAEQSPCKTMWALIFILALPGALCMMWESATMHAGPLADRLLVAAGAYCFTAALAAIVVVSIGVLLYFFTMVFGAMGYLLPGRSDHVSGTVADRPAEDPLDFI